ncbi:sugar porter family MFS transporter [Streptomyces sp. NBC_01186]|uniref:sugar porter family MFS transporter n=1 Tax=Streptomyces sp. NBC_01186 TaxID=2903765 RepID=UPI002E0FC5BF|nr:sugar porter family MFS transporter [Streptomyces sp. NBC_01186]
MQRKHRARKHEQNSPERIGQVTLMVETASHSQQPSGHHGKAVGISIAAAVGGFLFGFDSSVINGAVDALGAHFRLGSFLSGFVVSIALLGCAVGAWYAGRLADGWGRRNVMLLGSVMFLISSTGSAFAFSVPDLLVWRVIGGLGIGIASVIAPAYISEVAPASGRGALGSLQQLAITVGQLVVLSSNKGLAGAAGGASHELWFGMQAWRWMFLVGVVPALVYGGLALLIPESPRYLVLTGQYDQAAGVLGRVSGESDPQAKVSEIRETLHKEHRSSFADIRGEQFGLHPLVWVGIILAAFQQLVGINAIFYYSTTLWKSVGFSESDSFTTSVITAGINVVMTVVSMFFVDRVGRRRLLSIGSTGMFLSLLMTAVAFSQQEGSGTDVSLPHPYGPVALIGANAFVVFFALSWGPIMWIMLAEMFPNRMRAMALAIGTASNWIFNFIVTFSFEPMTRKVGLSWLYGAFAFFALLSFFFVQRKVPETKQRSLEQMTGETHQRPGRTPAP